MHILFVSNLYEPYARGGAEVIVKRSIEAAKAAGHTVSLFTARPWRNGARFGLSTNVEDEVTVHSFYPFNLFFYGDDFRWPFIARLPWHMLDQFNYHSAAMLRRVLAESKPDLVITHNIMGLGFTLPKVIKNAHTKHIHVLHDIQLAVRSGIMLHGHEHGWDRDGWPARAYQALARMQFGSPDVVVSPSSFLLSFYERMGYFPASKKIVLRNPIDPLFYEIHQQESAGPFRLLFVGQLVEHKGIDVLQRAYEELGVEESGRYSLDVVGSGVLDRTVAEWAKDQVGVSIHGRLQGRALLDRFAQADLLVLPTRTYENSPTVVFEALATGLPVCVSDIGGAAEAITHGKNGLAIKPNDVRALVDALRFARSQLNEWPTWRQHARDSVAGLDAKAYFSKLIREIET